MDNSKTTFFKMRLTPEEKQKLEAYAEKRNITMSEAVKRFCKEIFEKENVKMSIDEMMNELKHYTNADLRERTVNEICEMYYELFKGEN